MQVNIHEAKTNLSKLIERALLGEEVVIAKAGTPAVKLVRIKPRKPIFGSAKGLIEIIDDSWDKPMTKEEVNELFSL